MYDRWSLREIWLQSVSSSISRFRFAEQGPRRLPIRTQCSLLKSGSQVSRKSERLHHPTGRASAVCRTFEMTYVFTSIKNALECIKLQVIYAQNFCIFRRIFATFREKKFQPKICQQHNIHIVIYIHIILYVCVCVCARAITFLKFAYDFVWLINFILLYIPLY